MELHVLLTRAAYLCEYCHRPLVDLLVERDHIIPLSRGGSEEEWNLAIACPRCNRNKGDNIEWVDLLSGRVVPLFDPRTMKWREHFTADAQELRGKSPIGRATAALLFRQTPNYLPPDLRWGLLADLHDNKPIYYFLNHARYRRLQNDFGGLLRQLQDFSGLIAVNDNEARLHRFIVNLLLLEIYFTRSTLQDVEGGVTAAAVLLDDPQLTSDQRKIYQNALSVLYQQRATALMGQGNIQLALADQKKSREFHILSTGLAPDHPKDLKVWMLEPEMIVASMRSMAMAARYANHDVGALEASAWLEVIGDLEPGLATTCYSYLTDVLVSANNLDWPLIDRLHEAETDVLIRKGYGGTHDQARLFSVRRRWWVLHLLTERTPNWELLDSDMGLWRASSMFNEMRELKASIVGLRSVLGEPKARQAMSIIEQNQKHSMRTRRRGSND